jgi:hypothetical protein
MAIPPQNRKLSRESERIPRCLRRGWRANLKMKNFLTVKIPRGLPRGGFDEVFYQNKVVL